MPVTAAIASTGRGGRLPSSASQRSASTTTTSAARPGRRTNESTASQSGSSRVKSIPSAWTNCEPPTAAANSDHSGGARPRRDCIAEHDIEDAVCRAGGRHGTCELERAAEGEAADLEAVVRRRSDHDRVGQGAEREHHEPSGDPADDEARQGTGGRPTSTVVATSRASCPTETRPEACGAIAVTGVGS